MSAAETEHTPPSAEQSYDAALERDLINIVRGNVRGAIGPRLGRELVEFVTARSEGLLRPDTPPATENELRELLWVVDAQLVLGNVPFARETLDQALHALALGGLAVGSEPSTDALIEQLGHHYEIARNDTTFRVTVPVDHSWRHAHNEYAHDLHAALSAALAASAPKGE